MPLLGGLGRQLRAILGAKRRGLTTGLPVLLDAGPMVLNETSRAAVEMPGIGAAAIPALVAFDRHAVELAIHLRRPVELKARFADGLGELLGRIGIYGDVDRSLRRQPGREGFEVHAGRHIPSLLGPIPLGSELLGVVLFGVGHGKIGALGRWAAALRGWFSRIITGGRTVASVPATVGHGWLPLLFGLPGDGRPAVWSAVCSCTRSKDRISCVIFSASAAARKISRGSCSSALIQLAT